jgi:RimJ/RimL family protein N-acetyltransferase
LKELVLEYIIKQFQPEKTTDDIWEKYYQFDEEIFREKYPKDSLPDRELDKSFILDPHPHYDIYRWLVYSTDNNQSIIGKANLWSLNKKSPDYQNVKDKINIYISVKREFRRKKIATELLKIMCTEAKKLGKKLLRAEITEHDAGIAFCEFFNGTVVARRAQNRLYLDEVNWKQMDDWMKKGKQKASGVTLEVFEAVPEKDLDEYCQLFTETMNQAPSEDLSGEFILTPERRRLDEKTYTEKGYIWITIVSREPTGAISGLTEIFYHPNNPHFVEQELTGVSVKYRGRGLGKWLKADMLFYIRRRFPDVKYIDTGNNDINEAMLSINNRMGFKRYKSEVFYEFFIDELKKKLKI